MTKIAQYLKKHRCAIIWLLRIIVGATFVVSGVVKFIDLWGFIYKIEQYFNVWNIPPLRTAIFMISLLMSAFEFIAGTMLMTGSYKKSAAISLGAFMLFGMLPLSAYIYISNPVEDCGCFGDFWIISNGETFLKNIILSSLLIYLIKYNHTVKGIYHPYLQWMQLIICISYTLFIGLIGYNTQPLIDFRSYKTGSHLINDYQSDAEIQYIYQRDNEQQIFTDDNLPDSSWTFIKRIEAEETHLPETEFVITDEDEDITYDVINSEGEQLILLIPEIDRADISYTHLINDIYQYIINRGGSMICLIASDKHGIEYWRDISMAEYDIYTAEDTEIKELARGHISLLYLNNGIITWKRTLSSINDHLFANPDGSDIIKALQINGQQQFSSITAIHVIALIILLGIGTIILRVKRGFCHRNQKKN